VDPAASPEGTKKPSKKLQPGGEATSKAATAKAAAEEAKAHLSGAKFFPPFEDGDSDAGDPGEPAQDGIADCVAEIRRITLLVELTEGHEASDAPFVVQCKERLRDFEGQHANLLQNRRDEVPYQTQMDRKLRAIMVLEDKIVKTKVRQAATLAALEAAQAQHDVETNNLANQKARKTKLHKEVDALHQDHIPCEDISEEEEEVKLTQVQGARTRGQSPRASQASQAPPGDQDARVALVGEPRANRPCTKGEGKGKPKGDGTMSDDDGELSDTP
jgi:cell division protein FtsB